MAAMTTMDVKAVCVCMARREEILGLRSRMDNQVEA
jgi:hypothetical protein